LGLGGIWWDGGKIFGGSRGMIMLKACVRSKKRDIDSFRKYLKYLHCFCQV
jgi:hypothetical protein